MKNKPLLLWGLGAGIIALVAFIVGSELVWPVDDNGHKCGTTKDGKCGMMSSGMMSSGMVGGMSGMGSMMTFMPESTRSRPAPAPTGCRSTAIPATPLPRWVRT
ncbi:MAG: hypothetical protein ACYDGS_02300 [Thermoleophilia bacterium]